MTLRSAFISIGCLILCVHSVHCAGTTSGSFLKLGVGAKNIAMGDTGATEISANSAYWNPGGLLHLERNEASFMHAVWLDNVTFQNISYAHRFAQSVGGISATYLSMPAIDKYDSVGRKQTDTYKPTDMALALSYAWKIRTIPLGVSLKYVSSRIDTETASAFAVDAGVVFSLLCCGNEGKLLAGAAVRNAGFPMKFVSESFPLPFNVRAGLSFLPTQKWEFNVDAEKYLDTDIITHAGAQYRMWFRDNASVAGRLGYRSNVSGFENMAGFTAGVGLGYRRLSLDYAFIPYSNEDMTHRISLTFGF